MESNNKTEAASSPTLPASDEHSLLQETEHFELSTTVDPSYIIHLIRQLLPALTERGSDRPYYQTKLVNNFAKVDRSLISERQERECNDIKNKCSDSINNKQSLCDVEEGMKADSGSRVLSEEQHPMHENSVEGTRKEFPSFFIDEEPEDKTQLINPSNEHRLEQLETLDYKSTHCSTMPTSDSYITEEQKEEAGCVLWDLAANQSHADFMVENRLLDVLMAVLSVPHKDRMREICLGIMGNLACHPKPTSLIVRIEGLIEKVIQNLFVDDSPSLCEACRLLSAGLHGEEAHSWLKSIASEEILERIMWITGNTLQSHLLEKSTELLLAMVDGQGDVTSTLIPILMQLGLQELLRDLLTCEITALIDGKSAHGNRVLDALLQIAEALSLADDYASQLAADGNLFSLACQVVQLSGKEEVGAAGITATVLIANLLAEKEGLILNIVNDATFLKPLLELLPCISDDPGARNALWSILDRICNGLDVEEVQSRSEMTSVLADCCEMLSEDLEVHMNDIGSLYYETSAGHSTNGTPQDPKLKLETVAKVVQLLEKQAGLCDHAGTDIDHTIKRASRTLKKHLQRGLNQQKMDTM